MVRNQVSCAHAKQAQALSKWHALQAQASRMAQAGRISNCPAQGQIAGHRAKVGIAQLDAHCVAGISPALEIISQANAQVGKNPAQFIPIVSSVQIAFEGAFPAQ